MTILDKAAMMPRDDSEAVAVIRKTFAAEGIALLEKVDIERIETIADGISVILAGGRRVEGSHLLVAAGRRPNVENLGLDAAGIVFSPKGIQVDDRLRTSNAKVFAAGDVAGGPQFTHWAGYHAGIILRNALFRLPAKVDMAPLPWVTYTEPELAQVGLTEADSRARFGESIRVLKASFADNDRARAERRIEGFVKAVTDAKGRILGATIVGPHAGELIQTWGLDISNRLKIGAMAEQPAAPTDEFVFELAVAVLIEADQSGSGAAIDSLFGFVDGHPRFADPLGWLMVCTVEDWRIQQARGPEPKSLRSQGCE
ncbi:MAG: FAD-dependent oxidoreductase [Alphaproteobacteria bacterium]|nr:FAD-dependent oxidoreductase [Alphaproteobacteria bacterium]